MFRIRFPFLSFVESLTRFICCLSLEINFQVSPNSQYLDLFVNSIQRQPGLVYLTRMALIHHLIFSFLHLFFKDFQGYCKHINNYWYHHHPLFPFFFLVRFTHLSIFSIFFFQSMVHRDSKIQKVTIFYSILLIKTKSGLLPEKKWCVCVSKSPRISCISFSKTELDLWINYYFYFWQFFHFT